MTAPHFLVAGAARSGTTWLWQMLDRHPDLYMAKPAAPEPKFFLVDELYAKGLDHYRATWFADIGSARLAGEKSTNYMERPEVALRIHRHLPGVRLVFILREPMSRAFNNYLWSRGNGLETLDFATSVAREGAREADYVPAHRYSRPFSYVSRGMYADLLRPFFALFPRERLLVLKYEDIALKPEELARKMHGFLGVEARPEDALGLGVVNPAVDEAREEMPAPVAAELARIYRKPNAQLAKLLGPEFEVW